MMWLTASPSSRHILLNLQLRVKATIRIVHPRMSIHQDIKQRGSRRPLTPITPPTQTPTESHLFHKVQALVQPCLPFHATPLIRLSNIVFRSPVMRKNLRTPNLPAQHQFRPQSAKTRAIKRLKIHTPKPILLLVPMVCSSPAHL